MIFSENRLPSRIKSGTGFFGIMRQKQTGKLALTRLPFRPFCVALRSRRRRILPPQTWSSKPD
jgi:hypothetical protein